MIDKINVEIESLLSNKLKLEEYFILFCLVNSDEDLLVKYITHCGAIDTNIFQKLRQSGFIVLSNEVDITFNSIRVTDQTEKLFGSKNSIEFDLLFQEVLATYPNKVKRLTGGTRRLHNDLVRCKKNYKTTIVHNGVINLAKAALLQFVLVHAPSVVSSAY